MAQTNESLQKESFLHKTINVTEWMKEHIEKYVHSKGYNVVLFDINTEVMTRMGKITTINTFTLKMKDKNGNLIVMENYNSMNKEYEDMNLKWLVDFVKEREMEAILVFGGKALGTEKQSLSTPDKNVEFEVQGEKNFGNLKITIFFSSCIQDMIKFITVKSFYMFWMGPTLEENNGVISFENVSLRNIQNTSEQIKLEYKWKDWNDYSQVTIDLIQVGNVVKVVLNQKNIPIALIDNVRNHWNQRIFPAISSSFKCAIKDS
jgi:activator of HSP90 ATPase